MHRKAEHEGASSISTKTVHAAVAGDSVAYREIYDTTSEKVYRLMFRMVGHQDADDLTQQVFLQVFRKIGQFNGQSKFETWLYRLATNEALQSLRSRRLRKTQPLVEEPSAPNPEHVELREHIDLIRCALTQLDPQLRLILSLKEDNDLSYQQIADSLGIPEGTVGSRLNRARRELRAILEANGILI